MNYGQTPKMRSTDSLKYRTKTTRFLQIDIVHYYSNINPTILNSAHHFAKKHTQLTMNPKYINAQNNHPKFIKMGLIQRIGKRITQLSSNEDIFNKEKDFYNSALEKQAIIIKLNT